MTSTNPCIIVADRARARLFGLNVPGASGSEEPSGLVEYRDLVNPEGELTAEQLFRDTRSGRRNRSSVAGGGYGLDDRKERERLESSRRFASEVAGEVGGLLRSRKSKALVLVASPKFLGVLRPKVRKVLPKGVELTVLSEDLSWHATAHIEKVLTRRGVLPPREVPEAAYRPRAQPRPVKAKRRTAPQRP